MPPTAETQSESPRRRVTGIIARHRVSRIDACRQGPEVALHCQTTAGTVVLLVSEINFVRGCRGPKDHNGNPFRTIEQIHAALQTPQEVAGLARQVSGRNQPVGFIGGPAL